MRNQETQPLNVEELARQAKRLRMKRKKRGGGLTIRHLLVATVGFALVFALLKLFQNHLGVLIGLSIVFGFTLLVGLSFTLSRRKAGFQDAFLELVAISRRTGLPLEIGLRAFSPQCGRSYGRRLVRLANTLETGVSLADAVAMTPGVLPLEQRVSFRVAEFAGSRAEALERISRVRHSRLEALRPLVDMLLYYLVVTWQMFTIGGFLAYFIAPKMEAIFKDFGLSLPPAFYMFGVLTSGWFQPIMANIGLFVMVAMVYVPSLFHSGRGMGFFGRFVPWLTTGERASVLRGLADTIRATKPVDECLLIFSEWSMRRQLRRRASNARRAMVSGTDWLEALRGEGLVRRDEMQLLRSAADVGRAAWALEQLADSMESRFWYRCKLTAQVATPAFTMLVGGLVFMVGLAFFTPLVDLIARLT